MTAVHLDDMHGTSGASYHDITCQDENCKELYYYIKYSVYLPVKMSKYISIL